MNMEERKAKGLLWKDTDEYLQEQARAKNLMYEFNHSRPHEKDRRMALLREMMGAVGESVWVEPPIILARGKTVTIGSNVYINSGLTMVDDWKITIGNGVLISPNVVISTTGHPVHPDPRAHSGLYSFPVTIEDDVWIGSGSVILPGVTIGKGAVIGAGSIVNKDIPPMVIAVGNPCKVLRAITERDRAYYFRDLRIAD